MGFSPYKMGEGIGEKGRREERKKGGKEE